MKRTAIVSCFVALVAVAAWFGVEKYQQDLYASYEMSFHGHFKDLLEKHYDQEGALATDVNDLVSAGLLEETDQLDSEYYWNYRWVGYMNEKGKFVGYVEANSWREIDEGSRIKGFNTNS